MSKAAFKLLLIILLVATCFVSLLPTAKATTYTYNFYGLINEDNTANLGTVNVTAIFPASVGSAVPPETFLVNGFYVYNTTVKPLYFSYDLSDYYGYNITRQYWLNNDEITGTYSVFATPFGLTPVAFNIRALGGVSYGAFLVASATHSVGDYIVIEKRPIDEAGNVVLFLEPYTVYSLSIEDGISTTYTFGNINTVTTPITLTISALTFPSSVLQQYKYLRLWASRPSSTEITVSYQDTNLQTISVVYTINYANGSTAYTATHTSENSFSDTWTSADSNVTYYVAATVIQSVFGTSTFAQVLPRSGTSTSPIDLSFLGPSWPVDPTQIFWALIVFIVFGCFSVLNAYIGAFAGVATAVIFTWLGWLVIPAGAVVAAFTLVFLVGIVYWKRRGG